MRTRHSKTVTHEKLHPDDRPVRDIPTPGRCIRINRTFATKREVPQRSVQKQLAETMAPGVITDVDTCQHRRRSTIRNARWKMVRLWQVGSRCVFDKTEDLIVFRGDPTALAPLFNNFLIPLAQGYWITCNTASRFQAVRCLPERAALTGAWKPAEVLQGKWS